MQAQNEYHVASFVAQIDMSQKQSVTEAISQVPGAEVHAVSDIGKLVFTIEAHTQSIIGKLIDSIKYQAGVLTLAPVYHQYLSEENEERP